MTIQTDLAIQISYCKHSLQSAYSYCPLVVREIVMSQRNGVLQFTEGQKLTFNANIYIQD